MALLQVQVATLLRLFEGNRSEKRSRNSFLDTTTLNALEFASAGEVVAPWDAEQAGSYA